MIARQGVNLARLSNFGHTNSYDDRQLTSSMTDLGTPVTYSTDPMTDSYGRRKLADASATSPGVNIARTTRRLHARPAGVLARLVINGPWSAWPTVKPAECVIIHDQVESRMLPSAAGGVRWRADAGGLAWNRGQRPRVAVCMTTVVIQAAWLTVRPIHAANGHPAPAAQEAGNSP